MGQIKQFLIVGEKICSNKSHKCIVISMEIIELFFGIFLKETKGRFTRWPKVEKRRNSSNLIGG
jgi:hypothetical protein